MNNLSTLRSNVIVDVVNPRMLCCVDVPWVSKHYWNVLSLDISSRYPSFGGLFQQSKFFVWDWPIKHPFQYCTLCVRMVRDMFLYHSVLWSASRLVMSEQQSAKLSKEGVPSVKSPFKCSGVGHHLLNVWGRRFLRKLYFKGYGNSISRIFMFAIGQSKEFSHHIFV